MNAQSSPTPIAYDVEGAARAVGLSVFPIKQAIASGDLTARYSKSKRLIGHDELVDWFNHLPVDRPTS
ncbi:MULTISPECIES: hypothetical protein [unclassified Cryobacterium]|uniref:hypothetical protein n=1 Tax=unclassified Cryobacterium TaxID=2649013 RepID=UPI00106C2557|nr:MULTISPECIES: hypothetical protein [unclassified Cryobacterium]TFB96563.1 hypothetical protein E3O39_10860 [Cryobacterium sp. MDB2-A-1]TFC12847.1 hypothetical protein E3O35_08020 [Cryobacterium sp. MDB2-A-2]